MRRKNIAVCVTGYDQEYESAVVNGVYQRCVELDYNLLVFADLIRKPDLNSAHKLAFNVVRGESEIFNLINYDMVDGIIILGDSIVNVDSMMEIDRIARIKGIPTVNVNDPEHTLQENILLSDSIAMEFVVEHLISEHKLTKINFIGGFPGNLQTEERLSAYKKVLTRHGLPVEESRIAYGQFWKKSIECTEQFMSADEKPEAIVCASDAMAIFSIDWLNKHGYKVPEDIIVTGFDGIKDGKYSIPSITTVRRAFGEAGKTAVELINDIISGKDVPDTIYIDSVLEKRQSCGCIPMSQIDTSEFYIRHYDELNAYKGFNTYIIDMNTKYASAGSSEDIYLDTVKGAEFFKLKRMYICIGSDIEGSEPSLDNRMTGGYNGLCKSMVSMISYGHNVPSGTKFNSEDLLPEDIFNGEKAVFFAFSPLYFKDRFLGYMAYEPSRIFGLGELFSVWTMQISNNAGSYYMNKELEYFVDRLESMYICDPLTGLYNRRGLDRFGAKLFKMAKEQNMRFTVFCADIDHLKPINDMYGHEAGDNAILQTAKAIENSAPDNSVCVRTGGDEYCILVAHTADYPIKDIEDSINRYLDDYNKNSGLAYNVGCSCGWSTGDACNMSGFDELYTIADENMYRTKLARKAAR